MDQWAFLPSLGVSRSDWDFLTCFQMMLALCEPLPCHFDGSSSAGSDSFKHSSPGPSNVVRQAAQFYILKQWQLD